jgi:hypothetical protein
MKKQILALVCTAALTLSLTSCVEPPSQAQQNPTDEATSCTPTYESVTDSPTPPPPPVPPVPNFDIDGVTWFVEPMYLGSYYTHWNKEWVHNSVYYHSHNNAFWSWDFEIADERTLEPFGEYADEGGFGGIHGWHYDADLRLFGYTSGSCSHSDIMMFPISEFTARFPWAAGYLLIVNKVDSTRRYTGFDHCDEFPWESLEPDAYQSEFALFYNGQFITEFEPDIRPDNPDEYGWFDARRSSGRFAGVVALERDGKFGVINNRGETIVPFALDDIQIIDDYTAFARIGDYHWGIIAWVAPEDVPHRETTVFRSY